jgi:hypothetical protein
VNATPVGIDTATGATCFVPEEPLPNCPFSLDPQHHASPAEAIPQLKYQPADTSVNAKPPGWAASSGVYRVKEVPSPSCPNELLPQHHTRPVLETAQVWL